MSENTEAVVLDEANKTVDYDGESYTVAKEVLDDVEVMEAWEDGKHVSLCRTILGADQWKRFKSKKRNISEMYELLTALMSSEEADTE